MRKSYLRIILFILAYSGFANPSFSQISNVERQDQIIRNQQQIEEEEKGKNWGQTPIFLTQFLQY